LPPYTHITTDPSPHDLAGLLSLGGVKVSGFHRVLFLVVMSGSLNAKVLKNHRFKSQKDIKAALVHWLQQQARDFFVEGVF